MMRISSADGKKIKFYSSEWIIFIYCSSNDSRWKAKDICCHLHNHHHLFFFKTMIFVVKFDLGYFYREIYPRRMSNPQFFLFDNLSRRNTPRIKIIQGFNSVEMIVSYCNSRSTGSLRTCSIFVYLCMKHSSNQWIINAFIVKILEWIIDCKFCWSD